MISRLKSLVGKIFKDPPIQGICIECDQVKPCEEFDREIVDPNTDETLPDDPGMCADCRCNQWERIVEERRDNRGGGENPYG